MPLPDRRPVDTRRERSLEFGPPEPPATTEGDVARSLVPMGPGRPTPGASAGASAVERPVGSYPIQPAKVQRPALREETLSRERLLDWLKAKVHHRVVHVLAEAGYGKTTLLADFARRTRLRTLWYRLDTDDRNWVAFLSYLVAAGQAQQASFAQATSALLREVGAGGPSLDAVLESFVRELEPLGEAGALLILDDFHLVDEAPDVRHIMRTLRERAPERVNFVFASRRPPGLPVARLRAQGEVAELHTDDLRFSPDETERLFRDTYGRPLEADVLTDLSERTEGWAASLQLVNSAIKARTASEVRAFVRSLSGAEGDLYDYLAEEVIGTLPLDLQQFLMRVAVLQELDPALMETATELPAADVARLAAEGERCGLLVRGHDGLASHRALHPLVRQFLLHRLASEIGSEGVRELHLSIARQQSDRWTVACHHFAEAGRPDDVLHCLQNSVGTILAAGQMPVAAEHIRAYPPADWTPELAILKSRAEILASNLPEALRFADMAFRLDGSHLAAQNLSTVHVVAGSLETAIDLTRRATAGVDPNVRELLGAFEKLLECGLDGDLADAAGRLRRLSEHQRAAGQTHYYGISMLNLAYVLKAQGEASQCLSAAAEAERSLAASGSSTELIATRLVAAWAQAHVGTVESALTGLDMPVHSPNVEQRVEVVSELASLHIWYGNADVAAALLQFAPTTGVRPLSRNFLSLAEAELAIRLGLPQRASRALRDLHQGLSVEVAHRAHQLAIEAHLALIEQRPTADSSVAEALDWSRGQGAWFWWTYTKLISELLAGSAGVAIPEPARQAPGHLSIAAEAVVGSLHRIKAADLSLVSSEATKRPERWRPPLRRALESGLSAETRAAAELLDVIGEHGDVALLRSLAKNRRARGTQRELGRALAKRLAHRLVVEDQGRVRLRLGTRVVEGSTVRRKVLALLCFLVSRPKFSATRDEVLDALWPDLDPQISGNSLNQTVYFLRRVIEPEYTDDTSAGYVRFEGNLLWLDGELVESRSAHCWALISSLEDAPTPDQVAALARTYRDRFALDFAYEDWAIPYRDALHAAFLQVMEKGVAEDIKTGHFDRAVGLIRSALNVDRHADDLEAFLVRLYNMTGAHSAAAEQYSHYAAIMRMDYGVDPPPLDALN